MTDGQEAPRKARPRAPGRGVPLALLAPALLGLAFLLVPLLALLLRAPWRDLPEQLTSPEVWEALRLSLLCATTATALSLVVGVPLAWLLARTDFPGRGLVRALVTLPLVLPPVVGGVALLLALGRNGVVGQWLDAWFGITLPFTTTAAWPTSRRPSAATTRKPMAISARSSCEGALAPREPSPARSSGATSPAP